MARAAGRRGVPVPRRALSLYLPANALTRSELERRLLAPCARFAVPMPCVNARLELDGHVIEVDFVWPAHR